MQTLTKYGKQSRQKNNKQKNTFYVYHKAAHMDIKRVEDLTRFQIGKFALTYLGYLVGYAKEKKSHIL